MARLNYSLKGRIRGAEPPSMPGIEVEVVRIVSTDNRQFYLLSKEPWGAYYHWTGKSVRCTHPETCEYHDRAVPTKWRAYIHALEQHGVGQREVIIELTHTAIVMLEVALCGQPYRGSVAQLRKTKGGKHGRFIVEVLPRRIDPATLPEERDPSVIMHKLWDRNARRDGPDEKI